MKSVSLIFIFLTSLWSSAEPVVGGENEEPFVCNPSFDGVSEKDKQSILKRMNLDPDYCITPADNVLTNSKEQTMKITNGTLYVSSAIIPETTKFTISLSHQCRGQKKSKVKKMTIECGLQNMEIDRVSPGAVEFRKSFNQDKHLSEQEIDRLVAKQINAWIGDPMKNIEEKNGLVTIKALQKTSGSSCYSPENLTYKTNCK